MSILLLSSPATSPSCSLIVNRNCSKNISPGVHCRLDYCNSLMYGVADSSIRMVHSVQNAAARLITGARRQEHITPVADSCTGFQSVNECRSNWPVLCTSHYMVSSPPLSTWSMTFSFLLTADGVSFDQPTTEHALSHSTVSATETFLLPDPGSETIFHRNCDT